jgi:osmotically-inducible protein OsmY
VRGNSTLTEIERELEAAGLHVVVEEVGDRYVLSGHVDSPGDRQAAEDIVARIVARVDPNRRIDNDIEIEMVLPDQVGDYTSDEPTISDLPDDLAEVRDQGGEIEPDFTDQTYLKDPIAASGPSSGYEDPAESGDDVYVPPTDPVVTTDRHGQAQVLGGFSGDSMEEIEVPRSTLDGQPGDAALAGAIARELREDASTTDLLGIRVLVRDGVAYLRGTVPLLEDAENAEEVAGRVPGVVEVVEELEVRAI